MAREALLHFRLQGVVFGIPRRIAGGDDAAGEAAAAELRIFFERHPPWHLRLTVKGVRRWQDGFPGVRYRTARIEDETQRITILRNCAQTEHVLIHGAERHKKSAATHIPSTYHYLMREFIFQTKVVVVGGGRALGMLHGVDGDSQVISQTRRWCCENGDKPIGKGIA